MIDDSRARPSGTGSREPGLASRPGPSGFDPARSWAKDGAPLNFEKIAGPIIAAIHFAYRLERRNGRKSIPWKGPEIGWQERACCPRISERFKAGNLAYAEDDQGRDALTEIVSAAIQLGIEQGRRLARSSVSDLLDSAYGSVFTLRVGHDSTQLHLQSGFAADPVTSLKRAIEALKDEQGRLKRCPQYRRHAIAMEAQRGGTPKSGPTAEGGDSAGLEEASPNENPSQEHRQPPVSE